MNRFRDWVKDNNLIDIPLNGRKFTWKRGNSKSKLDRILCDHNWFIKFPNLTLKASHTHVSDHVSLILNLEMVNNWGPKPFRSLDTWLVH